ncbi:hypothetical protein RHO13_03915 [Orbus wheelerorum]|uniref:hypothetical protein n=1 Tax=Orbus wheelerorum TaxID=3074111 RepID=UPI00370D6975
MFIIFGWEKEEYDKINFTQCYCYNCSEVKRWVLHTEVEWVSFFAIKTVPFLIKRNVYCERCGDSINIANLKYMSLNKSPALIIDYIECTQFAKKNDTQKSYLIEKRQQSEQNMNDRL